MYTYTHLYIHVSIFNLSLGGCRPPDHAFPPLLRRLPPTKPPRKSISNTGQSPAAFLQIRLRFGPGCGPEVKRPIVRMPNKFGTPPEGGQTGRFGGRAPESLKPDLKLSVAGTTWTKPGGQQYRTTSWADRPAATLHMSLGCRALLSPSIPLRSPLFSPSQPEGESLNCTSSLGWKCVNYWNLKLTTGMWK